MVACVRKEAYKIFVGKPHLKRLKGVDMRLNIEIDLSNEFVRLCSTIVLNFLACCSWSLIIK
jgi:hypothetical protein